MAALNINPATARLFRIADQYGKSPAVRRPCHMRVANGRHATNSPLRALWSGAKGRTGVDMSIHEPLLPWMRRPERGARASTFEQWEVGRGFRQFVARQSRRLPIWPLFLIGLALLSLGLLVGPRV